MNQRPCRKLNDKRWSARYQRNIELCTVKLWQKRAEKRQFGAFALSALDTPKPRQGSVWIKDALCGPIGCGADVRYRKSRGSGHDMDNGAGGKEAG